MRFLFAVVVSVGFAVSIGASAVPSPKTEHLCSVLLLQQGTNLEVTHFWNGEAFDEKNLAADLNGVLVFEAAEFAKKHKRWPNPIEFQKALGKYGGHNPKMDKAIDKLLVKFEGYYVRKGAAKTPEHLHRLAAQTFPGHFAELQLKARKEMMEFFKRHLRFPSREELATEAKMDVALLNQIVCHLPCGWSQAKSENPTLFMQIQEVLGKAFVRAARQADRPMHLRTQKTTPCAEEIFYALIRPSKGRHILAGHLEKEFSVDHVKDLLGIPRANGEAPVNPVLFAGGITELEAYARATSPSAFQGFKSDVSFNLGRMEEAAQAITDKGGFLITSATAGVPLDEGQLALMVRRAEELDYPILLMPAGQVLEGLDDRLLNHPRIFVVTNTIENPALKIWAIPILPKNQNPFASLDQRGQFVPGQTTIVGHPQLAHRIVPTGSNQFRETSQWSPGSLSQPFYPYRHVAQGRTSALAAGYHKNGFLIAQKADKAAGLMGEGVTNHWHIRNVEYVDDTPKGGTAGFTDMGTRYSVTILEDGAEISTEKVEPEALIVADLHDWKADQRMVPVYESILRRYPSLRDVFIHDPIDGYSHNHHEADRLSLLMSKYKKGELDYFKEMMGLVQTTNALLNVRSNIRVIFPDSNHSYWGRQLIDKQVPTQSVVNGQFLAELTHARRVLGFADPLEYVFQYRNQYIDTLPPDVRMEFEEASVRVADPRRVKVIPFGVPHVIGPEHRPLHLNFHGHQGANGAKASVRSHAAGNANTIVGDSHQSGILGGLMVVGTSLPKKVGYNDGGYSSWNNAFAIAYPDGTKQLLTYSSLTGTFEQRPEHGYLVGSAFFGDEPLKVTPTDNERLPNTEIVDQHSMWLDMMGSQFPKKPD